MAALIASPKKKSSHRMPCILMEKLLKQLKGFFVLCLTSVFFNIMHFKKYQEEKRAVFPSKKTKTKKGKPNEKRTKVKQKD